MMVWVAKMVDGSLAQIVRVQEVVDFSSKKNWILICKDFQKPVRSQGEFEWILEEDKQIVWHRHFNFGDF